jgi:glycosyltransferase involved in cell wall biosynthesis
VYGAIQHNMEDKQCLRLLFFGQIRPYKNIELLVESVACFVPCEVFLTIVGQVSSIGYAEKITHKIAGMKNITLHFAFINDNDIPLLLSQYDALIFPYDVQSSLNSGAIILACSYKKTVISAEIGTLKEMDGRYFLSYSYKNEKEHREKLTEMISKAINMKKINPQIFSDWGEQLYYDIQDNNSLQVVAEHIKQVYAD